MQILGQNQSECSSPSKSFGEPPQYHSEIESLQSLLAQKEENTLNLNSQCQLLSQEIASLSAQKSIHSRKIIELESQCEQLMSKLQEKENSQTKSLKLSLHQVDQTVLPYSDNIITSPDQQLQQAVLHSRQLHQSILSYTIQIQTLKASLRATQGQLQANALTYQHDLRQLMGQLDSLNSQHRLAITNLQQTLDQKSSQMEKQKELVHSKQMQLLQISVRLNDLERQNLTKQERSHSLQQDVNRLTLQLQALLAQKEQCESQLRLMKQDLEQSVIESNNIDQVLRDSTESIEQLRRHIWEANKLKEDSQSECEKLRVQLQGSTEQLQRLQREKQLLKIQLQKFKYQSQQSTLELKRFKESSSSQLSLLNSNLNSFVQRVSGSKLTEQQFRVQQAKNEVLFKELSERNSRVSELDRQLQRLKSQIQKQKAEIKTKLHNFQIQERKKQENINLLKLQNQSLRTIIQCNQNSNDSRLKELQAQLAQTGHQLSAKNQQIYELKEMLKNKTKELQIDSELSRISCKQDEKVQWFDQFFEGIIPKNLASQLTKLKQERDQLSSRNFSLRGLNERYLKKIEDLMLERASEENQTLIT